MLELEEADLWDGIAGWSSAARTEAFTRLLARRAPGARVLELRAGAGVFAVLAARLGAARVVAQEASDLADVARELVAANRLEDRVAVVRAASEGVGPFDLAFTAAFGADPFADGILRALDGAAASLAPDGVLAPRRIVVRGALASAASQADEAAAADEEIARWEQRFDLDLGPARASLASPGPYRYFTESEDPLGPTQVIWDLPLGAGRRPRPRTVRMRGDGSPAGGVVAWHELELDQGIHLGGPPGSGACWPPLVVAWSTRLPSDELRVRWSTADGRIIARADPKRIG